MKLLDPIDKVVTGFGTPEDFCEPVVRDVAQEFFSETQQYVRVGER